MVRPSSSSRTGRGFNHGPTLLDKLEKMNKVHLLGLEHWLRGVSFKV